MIQNHHLSAPNHIINTVTTVITEEYSSHKEACVWKKGMIRVYGIIDMMSDVEVVDRVVTVSIKKLFLSSIGNDHSQRTLPCVDHIQRFLEVFQKNKLEIALRIMESLRRRNLITSCEHIEYDRSSLSLRAYFRQQAALPTQSVPSSMPPIYLGPFEEVCEVQQREFAISSASSAKPILATWHLATCFSVVGFDYERKIGFIFHIDDIWGTVRAIAELKKVLLKTDDKASFSFQYILMGGVSEDSEGEDKKNLIEEMFSRKSRDNISFIRREYQDTVSIRSKFYDIDSVWSQAVRLCRSIAVDLRKEDPLSDIMGYEAQLNPCSSYYTRVHTLKEAIQIIKNMSHIYKCIYTGD